MLHWIEEHPYLSGGSLLALIIAWVLFRNATSTPAAVSSSVNGQSDALTAMQIQSGTQVQQTQLAAQTQVASDNAAVNITQLNNATAETLARLNAQVQLQAITSYSGSTDLQTLSALRLGLAQIGINPAMPGTPSVIGSPILTTSAGASTPAGARQSQITPPQAVNFGGETDAYGLPTSVLNLTPGTLNNADSTALGNAYETSLKQCSVFDGSCIQQNQATENDYVYNWARLNPALAASAGIVIGPQPGTFAPGSN